jgi:hypothetical protein
VLEDLDTRPSPRTPVARGRARRSATSRAIWVVVGTLVVVWAFAPIVALLIDVALHGGVLSGAGSATAGADQFQYLSWIRESGAHGLIANKFDLAPTQGVFLQPMFLISGIAWRFGASLQLALLMWEPVAIVAIVAGFTAYAARTERGPALAAVVLLAVFYMTPLLPLLDWTHQLQFQPKFSLHLGMEELSPAWELWGYLPTAISLGLMPVTLLAGERSLQSGAGERRRWALAAAAGSLAVAWLHPWQGATLVMLWIALACWGRGVRTRLLLALPALAAAAPLAYYQILAHADTAWRIAQRQNAEPHFPAWILAAALAPLAVPAAVGLVSRPRDVHDRTIRLWIACGLLVYFTQHTFEEHALQGLSLPLAIMAAAGWRRIWRRGARAADSRARAADVVAATLVVALLTVPGVIWSAMWYRDSVRGHFEPYIFTPSEHAALTFLEHSSEPGGVLAAKYLGMAVPAFTGRGTWVGHKVWTPDYNHRAAKASALLAGHLSRPRARALVSASGARWLLADCTEHADLRRLLGHMVSAVHRFGCVTVYEMGGSPQAPAGPPRANS